MRLRVFARRANPAIDRPILHKSAAYCEDAVNTRFADWVDPQDHSKGIIAREMLPSGKIAVTVEIAATSSLLPPLEPSGCKFVPPTTAKPVSPTVRWTTAMLGKQISRRTRMEQAAIQRDIRRLLEQHPRVMAEMKLAEIPA